MSELVFTRTEERSRQMKPEHGRMPMDTKFSVWANERKVAITESRLVQGANMVPGKFYWYWITTTSFGFYRNRHGQVQPYYATRNWDAKRKDPWGHRNPTLAFEYLDPYRDEPEAEVFRRAVDETLAVRSLGDLYPIADRYSLRNYDMMPWAIRPYFRSDDWEDFCGRVFGKKRNTSRMRAAVAKSEPYFVSIAHQFRGLVDDDKILAFLENSEFDDEMEDGYRPDYSTSVRKVIKAMSQTSRDNLISQTYDLDTMKSIGVLAARYGLSYVDPDADYDLWENVVQHYRTW